MDSLLVGHVGRLALAILIIVLFEEASVETVVSSSQDATGSSSKHVQWKVVGEDALRIIGVVPGLEDSGADSKGRVETSAIEVVDRAESPKDKADSWNTPDAEVDGLGLGTSHVKDEKNEDEGANSFHIEGSDCLAED